MPKLPRYGFILLSIVALAAIRYFENELFYDPYLQFFKNDYLYIDSPRRETFKLTLFTSLRYAMNTLISLAVLFLVFLDKSIVRFSIIIYFVAYIILLALFLFFVINPRQEDYYLFFFTRRFLIQPLILIILLPAFYYHRIRRLGR